MTRAQKNALKQHQSTRQLMGILRLTPHGVVTENGEQAFFLIRPDNLSVLPAEEIRTRVRCLTNLLGAEQRLELTALDSRESFLPNKQYYQQRLEAETVPKLRELLRRDMEHLDEIQAGSASSREFLLTLHMEGRNSTDEGGLRLLEKAICDHGIRVRLAEEQDVKRLLAIYYQHDVTTEYFYHYDGEEYVTGHG